LAKQLGSVSQTCKTIGYRRDRFYLLKRKYDNGGEEALREISRKNPVIKNKVPEHIERVVIDIAIENPAFRQLMASQELLQRVVTVSSERAALFHLASMKKMPQSAIGAFCTRRYSTY